MDSPEPVAEHVRRRMASTKSRDTKPEMALRRVLHARGLRYRVNLKVLPALPRTVDVAFTRAKGLFELDRARVPCVVTR